MIVKEDVLFGEYDERNMTKRMFSQLLERDVSQSQISQNQGLQHKLIFLDFKFTSWSTCRKLFVKICHTNSRVFSKIAILDICFYQLQEN